MCAAMMFDQQSAGLWLVTSTAAFFVDALVYHVLGILIRSTVQFLMLIAIGLDNSTLPRPVGSTMDILKQLVILKCCNRRK
jgi:hypothetical protein